MTHIVVYLTIAMVLQFISAWLLMPAASRRATTGFWGKYTARVGICFGASVVAALVMVMVMQSLLDSSAI